MSDIILLIILEITQLQELQFQSKEANCKKYGQGLDLSFFSFFFEDFFKVLDSHIKLHLKGPLATSK